MFLPKKVNIQNNRLEYVLILVIAFLIPFFLSSSAFAQVSWTGAGDGTTWEDAGNWFPTVPGPFSDVVIDANLGGSYTIVLSSEVSINSLTLSRPEATLDLQAGLTITTTMSQTFGTLTGNADLSINGQFSWKGGRIEGAGTTFLNGGAVITGTAGSSTNNKILDQRRLVIPGGQTAVHAGGLLTGSNGAILDIREGGILDITTSSNSNVMDVGDGGATILNAGTILKSQGTTFQITIEWDLINSGLLSINQVDADIQLQGVLTDQGGRYIVDAGFLDVDLPASSTPYVFTSDSRLLAGTGARINLGSRDGDGSETRYELLGSVEMNGTFSVKNFNGGTTASVTIPATANLVSLGGELLLVGTSRGRLFVEVTDPVSVGDLKVGSRGRLELSSPLTVAGDYTQDNVSAVVVSDFDITIQGILAWRGGRMEGLGSNIANGGVVITGTGGSSTNNKILDQRRLVIPGGQTAVHAGGLLTGSNGAILDIREGGILDITTSSNSNVMDVGDGGATILNAGTILKSQGTTFQITIEWDLINSGLLSINQVDADIQLQGVLTDQGGRYIVDAGFLDVDLPASSTPYVFTSDSRLLAGTGARINLGSRDGDGSETRYELLGSVEMNGTFSVKNFSGGTSANVTIPATANLISLGGELLLVGTSRGRLFVEVTDPVSVGDLTVGSIGRLELSSPLTVAGDYTQNNVSAVVASDFDITIQGSLAWRGGRMEGLGSTIANGGVVITGTAGSSSNNKTLDQRRLVIPGGQTAVHAGGLLTGSNGAILDIREGGILDITTGSNSRVMDVGDGGATILNAGTISKSQGTTFQINIEWDLQNSGSLLISQDETDIRFREGIQNSGTIAISSNSALLVSDESIINEGLIRGIGTIDGTVENTMGTVQPGIDEGNTGILTIQGNYTQSETGTLSIKIGGTEPGTEYDRLVTSFSVLDGSIELLRLNGFSFSAEDEIKPLTWNEGSRTGVFASVMDGAFTGTDILLEYNSDGLIITALPNEADLIITAEALDSFGEIGAVFGYIVVVNNLGPQDIIAADVTSILAAGLDNVTWTCSADIGAVCQDSGAGDLDAMVDLPAGTMVIFSIVADLIEGDAQELVISEFTVTGPATPPDPDTDNNTIEIITQSGVFADGFESPPDVL